MVDPNGVIHTLVRGDDGAVWDNAMGQEFINNWYSIGGYIISNPSVIRNIDGRLLLSARGGDGAVWFNQIGLNLVPTALVGPIACDCTKIQDAVDALPSGGMVKVLSGTYTENVNIDKSLAVNGVGSGLTIVDGQKAGSVFSIGNLNKDVDVSLSKITARNGNNTGGIYNNGRLTVNDCIISGNTANPDGGGIYNNFGLVTVNGGSIDTNTADRCGGGIFNWGGTVYLLRGSVSYNRAQAGTGIYNTGSLTMKGGSINHNVAYMNGGGIISTWITTTGGSHSYT